MKHLKTIKLISNILFWLGVATAIAAAVLTYTQSANLPPGTCPMDRFRWVTYTALGVLSVSLVFSFLTDRLKRKERNARNS